MVYGGYPTAYNQVLLVVDENNEIDDMTLYALGLKSEEEINVIVDAALNKTELPQTSAKKWTFEEICNMQFRTVLNGDCYQLDPVTGTYKDLRATKQGLKYLTITVWICRYQVLLDRKKTPLRPCLRVR